MKKTLILMAAASAFVLTGCTESDLSGDTSLAKESAPSAIQFSAKTGNTGMTRAGYEGDLTNTSIKNATAGFGVFAYYSGKDPLTTWGSWNGTASTPVAINKAPNFMYNEHLSWSATKNGWDYSPVKYWPNGIDKANATDPSNTATETDPQYLSFFAYAPYVEASSTAYSTSNPHVGGDLPSGVTAAVYTTGTEPAAVTNGIVAMSKNDRTEDMHVKYILNPSALDKFVDLTWGLRGQLTYQETDNEDNTIPSLGGAYNIDLTKQVVDEKVKFLFKHALARVGGSTKSTTSGSGKQVCGLWAVVDVDKNSSTDGEGQSNQTTYFSSDFSTAKTLVTIESVQIRDAYTYTVTEDTETKRADTESDFLTDGWFDIMNGKWVGTAKVLAHTTGSHGVIYNVTAKKTPSSGEFNLNDEIKEGTPTNPNGADWTTSNSGGASGVDLTKKKVFADEDVPGLLLIPGGTGSNTLYITVKYIVRTADSKLSTGYSEVTQEITNKVTLDNNILKSNKYYNLVMHLGLTSVKFEAIVADWENGDGTYDEDGGEVTPGTNENNKSIWLPSNVVNNSVTVIAGTLSKSVIVPAATTSYTIKVTGLTNDNKVTVTGTNNAADKVSITPATITDGTATVSVTGMTANGTASPVDNVITIIEKNSGDEVITTTKVTITQAAAVVTP